MQLVILKRCDYDDMKNPDNLKYVPSFDKHMKQPGIEKLLQDLKENTFDKYDAFYNCRSKWSKHRGLEEWAGNENGKFNYDISI